MSKIDISVHVFLLIANNFQTQHIKQFVLLK